MDAGLRRYHGVGVVRESPLTAPGGYHVVEALLSNHRRHVKPAAAAGWGIEHEMNLLLIEVPNIVAIGPIGSHTIGMTHNCTGGALGGKARF